VKVKVLKHWICAGRCPEVGAVIELPEDLARSGIEKGLCRRIKSGRKDASSTRTQSQGAKKP